MVYKTQKEEVMSKRREVGDIVKKVKNAGFVGEELIIQITDDSSENIDFCMFDCGDESCREFANVDVLDAQGNYRGTCCHVSECQMEDIDATAH
jgi:hypothetical protein